MTGPVVMAVVTTAVAAGRLTGIVAKRAAADAVTSAGSGAA